MYLHAYFLTLSKKLKGKLIMYETCFFLMTKDKKNLQQFAQDSGNEEHLELTLVGLSTGALLGQWVAEFCEPLCSSPQDLNQRRASVTVFPRAPSSRDAPSVRGVRQFY